MDYGDDWPERTVSQQETVAPQRGRHSLLRRCAIVVVTYTVIAVAGLFALHIRQATGPTYRLDSPHTTYATTRAHPPHPGRIHRHPLRR